MIQVHKYNRTHPGHKQVRASYVEIDTGMIEVEITKHPGVRASRVEIDAGMVQVHSTTGHILATLRLM
jgi:hypothetical protein